MSAERLAAAGLRKAIRDAFDAGREQGSEEATSYEWGSFPMQNADEAFANFMADWNKDSEPLRRILAALEEVSDE